MTQPENQAEALDERAATMTDAEILRWIDVINHETARETLRDYMRLRASLPEAPAVPVGVRALEWEEIHQRRSDEDPTTEVVGWEAEAKGFACSYIVELTGGGASMRDPDYEEKQFDDPDAAKAAAHADFETRIRAALQSPPPVKADGDCDCISQETCNCVDREAYSRKCAALASQTVGEGEAVAEEVKRGNFVAVTTDEPQINNWHTAIYEDDYKGLLIALCNQNGRYPWQVNAILAGLNGKREAMEAFARPAAADAGVREASEDELCKLLVKIWGYKWVEFEDIPPPGDHDRDNIGEAYSVRLNAQDAVRGLLRRYSILSLAAKRGQTE